MVDNLKKRIDKIENKVSEVDRILLNQDTSIKEEAKKEKEKWMSQFWIENTVGTTLPS